MPAIYLDHNATTPVLPEVASAMSDVLISGPHNPASQHQFGRRARQRIEDARESIGRLLGAEIDRFDGDRLIFTSGGTESNQLALHGLCGQPPGHVIVSAIEHPSLLGASEQLQQRGFRVDRLPVNNRGVVEVERLAELLRPDTRLVSVMLANNETGVVQPVAEVARICTARGILVHTDASQVAGKCAIDFGVSSLGNVSALTCTAHKLHGPVGIGALLVRRGVTLEPLWSGGFQQAGLRPGTEPVALAVGFQRAWELADAERLIRYRRMRELRDRFESQLLAAVTDVIVIGGESERLPQTSNLAFLGLDRQSLLMALDLAGVACSTGSACASGSSEPSPVLLAMGLPRAVVDAAIRFSLGATTTADEIERAVSIIAPICRDLRAQFSGGKTPSLGTERHRTPL